MTRGRPAQRIQLSSEQRVFLKDLAKPNSRPRALAFRARIILLCAQGNNDSVVAAKIRTSSHTVGNWRRRFLKGGVDGLYDEPRVGAPRSVSDSQVEKVVRATLEDRPADATHWSVRTLAKKLGMSRMTIARIWRAFGLKPHLSSTFHLSDDPQFVAKVRDIVGLYLNPPDSALVLCVDEKSQIQALSRSQPVLPLRCGKVELRTSDYLRHGTTSLFAALDVKTGNVIGHCYRRHRSKEFCDFLQRVDASVPQDTEIHIILDNYATHKTENVKRWLLRHPRYHLHFTPTHASWINQVERWFALLTTRQIKRASHLSVRDLETCIRKFIDATNQIPTPFKWTKSADEILASVARFAFETKSAFS